MGKSSLAKVLYLHTNITVLTAKYSSLGLSKLNFRFVEKNFSAKWKKNFKGLKIFENKERFVLGRRSIALKPHFAAPCQAKNKNRLLSQKRAPTPHRHRVSVENQLIHRKLQSTTDTWEKNKEDFGLFDTFQCTISNSQLTIYDLNGRKIKADDLRELEKGIYIVNGKKVMIK